MSAVTKLSLGKWEHFWWCLVSAGAWGGIRAEWAWRTTRPALGERPEPLPDFGVNGNEKSSSYFIHIAKILGCLQIVGGCVLPID